MSFSTSALRRPDGFENYDTSEGTKRIPVSSSGCHIATSTSGCGEHVPTGLTHVVAPDLIPSVALERGGHRYTQRSHSDAHSTTDAVALAWEALTSTRVFTTIQAAVAPVCHRAIYTHVQEGDQSYICAASPLQEYRPELNAHWWFDWRQVGQTAHRELCRFVLRLVVTKLCMDAVQG